VGGAGVGEVGGGAGVGVGVASSGVASSRAQVLHETGQQIMSMAWLVHQLVDLAQVYELPHFRLMH